MGDNPSNRGVFIDKFCNSLRVSSRNRWPNINSVLDTFPGPAGNVTFNTPDKLPYYSNGISWIPFGQGAVPGCANVFVVEEGTTNPSNYATINLAVTAAIAAGHDMSNPAIICICPSSLAVPYDEDVTLRPGFHITNPNGRGFVTVVSGRWTWDSTGFPPPPTLFGNENNINGIAFAHFAGLGISILISGTEEGTVNFFGCALAGTSASHVVEVTRVAGDLLLESCGVVNFVGPAILVTGGMGLTLNNCFQTFSGGDFITSSSTDGLNIFNSFIVSFGSAVILTAGGSGINDAFIASLGAGTTFNVPMGSTIDSISITNSSLLNIGSGKCVELFAGGGGGTFLTGSTLQAVTDTTLVAASTILATGSNIFAGGPMLSTGIIIDISPGCGRQYYTGCTIAGGSDTVPAINIQAGLDMGDDVEFTGCYILNQAMTGGTPGSAVDAASSVKFVGCNVRSAGRALHVLPGPPPGMSPKFIEFNSCRLEAIAGGIPVTLPTVEIDAGLDPTTERTFLSNCHIIKFTGGVVGGETILNSGSNLRLRNSTIEGINVLQVINMLDGSMIEADHCDIIGGSSGFLTVAAIRYDISSPSTLPYFGVDNELFLQNCRVFTRSGFAAINAIDCSSATSNGNIRIYNSSIFATAVAIDNINSAVDVRTFNSTFVTSTNAYHFTGAGGGTVTFANMTFNSTITVPVGVTLAKNDGGATSTIRTEVDSTVAPPQIKNSSGLSLPTFSPTIDTTAGTGGFGITIVPLEPIEII